MSILTQKTVSKKISFEGIGIHTGEKVKLNILPSNPNTGIVFKRIDLKSRNIIFPNYANVSDTTLCTTISNEYGVSVSTIEHLMGAFYGVGIDNAIIEIDNQEVPILDGSAKLFVDKIEPPVSLSCSTTSTCNFSDAAILVAYKPLIPLPTIRTSQW